MTLKSTLPLLAAALAAGCSLAPAYHRPAVAGPAPSEWKTADGWQPARPSDDLPRSDWWVLFNDPTLNDLVARANRFNNTLLQAAATWREAVATTREARATLFPTVNATGGVTHTYSGSGRAINGDLVNTGTNGNGNGTGTGTGSGGNGVPTLGNGRSSTNYRLQLQASWQPDLFGRITNTVRNARYTEQARLADLANARLALQGELVTDYLSLRAADAQLTLLASTVAAYQRGLTITTNRYNAGIAPHSDVWQAQTQLATAQSDFAGEKRTRAQLEDAIAVLIGENPASFTIASLGTAWRPVTPDIPIALPSTLLERRPDIASAERQVAAANAEIGVNRAAFFPTLSLSGSGGFENDTLAGLFSSAATLWSVGAQAVETLLDFGARSARVAQSRAAYDATVANYRQVALTGLQQVQDDLVAARILAEQEVLLRTASIAADKSEQALRNQYKAGTLIYTNVVTAQATAQNARRALVQGQLDRQNALVALVQALGGGWQQADLTNGAEAARANGLKNP